jgi:carbonic anhydrase
MDSKKGALYTILILGGIGVLAVSCSDSDEVDEHGGMEQHSPVGERHDMDERDHETEARADAEAVHDGDGQGRAVHWGYEGAGAPYLWAGLKDEYAVCATGKQQSPIDITAVTVTQLPDIEFNYQASPLAISNNGHTIKVSYAPGSYITVDGKRYDLLQFHFHSPSEHTIGGKAYDMVAHLVHQAADGRLGVIGVMFKAGTIGNDRIAQLWQHMPVETGVTNSVPEVMINAADLFPLDDTYFNYSGSLTTPPCSEGVNWMVLAAPSAISEAQLQQFTDLFPLSTRPVQPLNGRVVNVSN